MSELNYNLILYKCFLFNSIVQLLKCFCIIIVVLSEIAKELKDSYSSVTEDSKIKRIQRFLSNKVLKPEKLYEFYIYKFLKNIKVLRIQYIIFDHATIQDEFVILQFFLKAGKRTIPLRYKIFLYKEDENKDFKHIPEI